MHPGEYDLMARAEDTHWWYLGLRDVVARCLERPDLAPPPGPRVLDAGCGTGATLRFLAERLRPSYLAGFDASEQALAHARAKAPGADVYPGDVCAPEIRTDSLDLVVCLDVIYIPGARRALGGLRALVDRLRPGGLLILNLPAYGWLYGEHDVAVHTSERFTAGGVRDLLAALGLERARLSYRVCALFPAVVLARIPGMLRARRGRARSRSDLTRVPREPGNRVFGAILRAENALIARGVRLPWGSSVFAVGRKPPAGLP